jgi:hypothetical protein
MALDGEHAGLVVERRLLEVDFVGQRAHRGAQLFGVQRVQGLQVDHGV